MVMEAAVMEAAAMAVAETVEETVAAVLVAAAVVEANSDRRNRHSPCRGCRSGKLSRHHHRRKYYPGGVCTCWSSKPRRSKR